MEEKKKHKLRIKLGQSPSIFRTADVMNYNKNFIYIRTHAYLLVDSCFYIYYADEYLIPFLTSEIFYFLLSIRLFIYYLDHYLECVESLH